MGIKKQPLKGFSGYIDNYEAFTDDEISEFGRRIDNIGTNASLLERDIQGVRPGYVPVGYSSPPTKINNVRVFLNYIYDGVKGEDGQTLRFRSKLGTLNRGLEDVTQEFALNNMNLIVSYAKKYAFAWGVDVEDLESLFNESVARAIRYFDFSRGIKFATFALKCMNRDFSEYRRKESKRREVINREGPEGILAKINGDGRINPEEIYLLKAEGGETLKRDIEETLQELNPIEEIVMRQRFYSEYNLTLNQTGQLIGVTKERVRQIQVETLGKLKRRLEKKGMIHLVKAFD